MLSDSPWDWQHLLELFIPMPGKPTWTSEANVVGRLVSSIFDTGRQQSAFAEALESYYRCNKGRHHALVDARALKAAFMESRIS